MTTVTYISHDESGNITSVMSGPKDVIIEPEGTFVNYTGDEEVTPNWFIKDGEPVIKPEQPSSDHVFNTATEIWEIELDVAKAQAWSRIKKRREENEFSTFTWNDHIFQCGEKSQQRITGATQRAQLDSTIAIDWTLADNTIQAFTGTEFIEVGKALSEHVSACHSKATTLRGQINSATTLEEIDAITW